MTRQPGCAGLGGCAGGKGGENGGVNGGNGGNGGDGGDGGEGGKGGDGGGGGGGGGGNGIDGEDGGGGGFALVMPKKANAMRRKKMRASRGADPKRPTEPRRRAEARLDTHLEVTAPAPMGGDPAFEAGGRAGCATRTRTRQPRVVVAIVNGRGVITTLRRARR